ncbi:MAG: hypothetical protein V1816_06615 [Pseudomonadota bacterium]
MTARNIRPQGGDAMRNGEKAKHGFLAPLSTLTLLGAMLLLPAPGCAGDIIGAGKMEKTTQQGQPALPDKKTDNPALKKGAIAPDPVTNRNGQALFYIRLSEISVDILNQLMARGATLTHIAERYKTVTAFVAPNRLDEVRKVQAVLNIQPADKPLNN